MISLGCYGQNNGFAAYKFWNQQSISGAVGLKGHYRNELRVLTSGEEQYIRGTLFSGAFLLKSKSFIAHPNLVGLDIEVEFNPEKRDRTFSTIPDRSEVMTLGRLNLRTTFFQKKAFTIVGFVDLNQSLMNRESLTNLKTNRKSWGGSIFYNNRVLPVNITYQEGNMYQQEIETNRRFSYWQRSIRGKMSKSLFSFDKNVLKYSFNSYIRRQFDSYEFKNKVHHIQFTNKLNFGSKKDYRINTTFSNLNQDGADNFNRLQFMTNMVLNLPNNLKLTGNYNFFDHRYPFFTLDQHRAKMNLSHQLFESLRTNVFIEYSYNQHSLYTENDARAGFNISYTKKIPRGRLTLYYMFLRRKFQSESDGGSILIRDEEHVLADDIITLLDKPFVELETVVVKDITSTIIYQLAIDYILIEQNNFVEIKRIPGGMIANNSSILVDYTVQLQGSYRFNLNNQSFSVNLILFDNFLELYYRRAKQNYDNVEFTDFIMLNYFVQNVFGIKFKVGFTQFGAEYDNNKSSIYPYELLRLFGNINWKFKNKLLISLYGNARYYFIINNRRDELYASLTAKIAYSFNSRTKLNLELGYRDDRGYQIDLDLLTARSEFTIIVRKIFITLGLEVYRRNYLNRETIDFNGAYLSLVRKF